MRYAFKTQIDRLAGWKFSKRGRSNLVFPVFFVRLKVIGYKPDESDFVCVFGDLSIILPFQGWDGLHKSYGGPYRFLLGLGPCAYGAGAFFNKFFYTEKSSDF